MLTKGAPFVLDDLNINGNDLIENFPEIKITTDIIEAVNTNYRALHDEIVANRIEDKNAQIQAQQNEINACGKNVVALIQRTQTETDKKGHQVFVEV